MGGRSAAAARRAMLAPLQRAVSCLTTAVLIQGRTVPDAPDYWTFQQRFTRLRGPRRLEFSVLFAYSMLRQPHDPSSWMIDTAGYAYQFREPDGPEVIAFHWHPGRVRQPDFPHLHVESPRLPRSSHVPTGIIPLIAVVRFAIVELDVEPIRPDWQQVIDDTELTRRIQHDD